MDRKVCIVGKDTFGKSYTLLDGESLDLTFVIMPGVSCDIPLKVEINGSGASAVIRAVYLCNSSEDVRLSIDMVHNTSGSMSDQIIRGIVGGRAHSDFFGKITVAQDAQKTEAYQSNHNLLLSEDARVNTRPQLEIYADDVKCSHGAAVGRLNEEEQFYMRSRGITVQEARALQMISFLNPVLSAIGDEAVVEEIKAAIRNL